MTPPAPRSRGIGRGLAAILAVSEPPDGEADELRDLSIDMIEPNPRQPRRHFDEQALAGLADSLGARGVLQPVLVRPRSGGMFELIAGERRWRAARLAGLERIPALVRSRGDAEALEIALIENMAREDLNPIEEARACAALVEELSLTREEVGLRIGRGRVAVSNLLRLLELPDEALAMLEAATLSEGHGRALLLAQDHDDRRALAAAAAAEGWSVRVLEQRARDANDRSPQPPARRSTRSPGLHPDQEDACAKIGDALGAGLGAEVWVKPAAGGGYRAELRFDSLDEALDLAGRLGRPRPAA
ncbi:MAG TPA: ParB/RepB/Spo0J family partition protein [Solirubrobacteraceae bacterium]